MQDYSLISDSPELAQDWPFPLALKKQTGGRFIYGVRAPADDSVLAAVRRKFSATRNLGVVRANFRPKAVFFDMDSTLIEQESLVELARAAGRADAVARITERAMAGELDFAAALRERLAMIQGTPEEVLHDVAQVLTLSRGVEPWIKYLQSQGVACFLVSGGFNVLAKPLAERLGFVNVLAHDLEVENGRLTGKFLGACVDRERKAQWLQENCARRGWQVQEAIAVGDGANDTAMLDLAGLAIGYQPKSILYPHLDIALGKGDFAFLRNVVP